MLKIQTWTKNYIKQGSEMEDSEWMKASWKTARKTFRFVGLGLLAFIAIAVIVAISGMDRGVGSIFTSIAFFAGFSPYLYVSILNTRVTIIREKAKISQLRKELAEGKKQLPTPDAEQVAKEALGSFKHAAKKTLATMDAKRAVVRENYEHGVNTFKNDLFFPALLVLLDIITFVSTGTLGGLIMTATAFVLAVFAIDVLSFFNARKEYKRQMANIQDAENQAVNAARNILADSHEKREKSATSVVYPD